MPTRARKKGFTLLELIVVLVILGIIAAIAIPTFTNIIRGSAQKTALTTAQAIARSANGIAALEDGGADETRNPDLCNATNSDEVRQVTTNMEFYRSASPNPVIAVTGGGACVSDVGNTAAQDGKIWVRMATAGDNNYRYACVWIDTSLNEQTVAKASEAKVGDANCEWSDAEAVSTWVANYGATEDPGSN